MGDTPEIVDVWMQHPVKRFSEDPIFESLRRWTGRMQVDEIPLEFTMGAMEAGGVAQGLMAAWCGPQGWLISHDEVAGWVSQHPDRLIGIASATRPTNVANSSPRCLAWAYGMFEKLTRLYFGSTRSGM